MTTKCDKPSRIITKQCLVHDRLKNIIKNAGLNWDLIAHTNNAMSKK